MTRDESPFGAEIIGPPSSGMIRLAEHDPRWADRFAAERSRIVGALGGVAVRVEHVGSTSVSGLAAKPIVDVQLSVPDVEDEDAYVPALEQAGYALRVREPHHRMLRPPSHDVHVHVCGAGSDWERRHLLFRDHLRASADDRHRYEDVKRQLATREWPTMDHYAQAKDDVIDEITARAETWADATGWRVPGTA